MFHIGKVVQILSPKDKNIISSDSSVQVIMKMWDENLINGSCEPAITEKLKAGDIVVVDYSPIPGTAAPRVSIVKILRGEEAKKAWKEYEDYNRARKNHEGKQIPVPFPQQQII